MSQSLTMPQTKNEPMTASHGVHQPIISQLFDTPPITPPMAANNSVYKKVLSQSLDSTPSTIQPMEGTTEVHQPIIEWDLSEEAG